MESEAVTLLRTRARELDQEVEAVHARLKQLQEERRQIDAGLKAMTGELISPSGSVSSWRAVVHHARLANPDAGRRTIKQLVVEALTGHFTGGATANDLLEFFAREYGRDDIVRTSLSPQLSRLKEEGKIVRVGHTWHPSDSFEALMANGDNENGDADEAEPEVGDGGGSNTPVRLDHPIASPASTS